MTICLTQKEADLLQMFVRNQDHVLKREVILEEFWDGNDYFAGRSLDVIISRLRKHLSQDNRIKINNYHGVGFKLEVDPPT